MSKTNTSLNGFSSKNGGKKATPRSSTKYVTGTAKSRTQSATTKKK